MVEESVKPAKTANRKQVVYNNSGPLGGIYFMTIVGAAVYFIEHADGFWEVIFALVQALFWPGFVIYRTLELLGM